MAQSLNGFIVYPTYREEESQTFIEIYGKLENGESFVSISNFEPYFYIKSKDLEKFKKLTSKIKSTYTIEESKLKTFHEEKTEKISFKLQKNLNKAFKEIRKDIETFEADIKPHFRFLMDKDLLGTIQLSGDYTKSEKVDRIYQNPEISLGKKDFKPNLKIASIDIESSADKGLYCIGIFSDNYRKTLMITDKDLKDIIKCKDEYDCLEKFKEEITNIDPDIITGWNFIDFDLNVLQELFRKNKIKFDIGRNNSNTKLRLESNFFKSSSADIPGRQVLDALNLIKDPFIQEAPSIKKINFESYTLENVAQKILSKGKLLKGKSRHTEIDDLYSSKNIKDNQKLAEYNLLDCELVYEILEKTHIPQLAIERSQLTGMPLDRLTSSIASFDSLYIRNTLKKGYVSPTNQFKEKPERITGGYVHSANPGIYNNVLILDFKSLYPSIIKTFNIDPLSFREKKEKDVIESPNKAYFLNQNGILPEIIETLHEAREKAKKEKRELSSYAIKIIMNSFFGVLASPNCRFFNLKMANAITNFGQFIIKLTASEIEKMGYKVIYSDTDSVFVESNLEKEKANKLGVEIQEKINKFYNDYVKKNYNRTSFLELEFEKQYLSMMIPKVRGISGQAAKKRYAGLLEKDGKESIQIVGLEAIRGDWTDAAQDFQIALLEKTFKKQPIEDFIRKYVKDIRAGKLNDKLLYRKSLRKSLDQYTKTTPPHVKAARKLPKLESNQIEYYITLNGPEPKQLLKSKIDYEHYIDKQIKPIAEQILSLINKDFNDLKNSQKQTKLF